LEERAELGVGGFGFHPIVCRARHVLARGADKGEMFAARDIVGIAAVKIATGEPLLIEPGEDTLLGTEIEKGIALLDAAVAPDDFIGLAKIGTFLNPLANDRGGLWGWEGFEFCGHGVSIRRGINETRNPKPETRMNA
jgi:hypothetical protein